MKKTPILLVTGFLGSGKTTFLNWLIHTHPDLNISLVLNEFGDVKLESQFIKKHSGEVAELANGCMCCVAKGDIPRVIRLILEKSPHTQYIVIEASGLSDPDPVRAALSDLEHTDNVIFQSTLCIVDAVNFEKTRTDHPLVVSQIGDADMILLSKSAEAGKETTARVKKFIENIGIGTKVLLWDDTLAPELFLNSDAAQENVHEKEPEKHDHEHIHEHEKYDEYWFKTDKPLDKDTFSEVMNALPSNVIRSKGYINANGKKMMIQYVPDKLEFYKKEWGNETPNTAVLFLGKALEKEELQKSLEKCVVT